MKFYINEATRILYFQQIDGSIAIISKFAPLNEYHSMYRNEEIFLRDSGAIPFILDKHLDLLDESDKRLAMKELV
jgi:hypothetical protein